MADDTTQASSSQPDQADDAVVNPVVNPKDTAKSSSTLASWTPVTTRGQKYVSPVGRHSQQTHRRARDRATVGGHDGEKAQHADDRSRLEAELKRRADLRLQQMSTKK